MCSGLKPRAMAMPFLTFHTHAVSPGTIHNWTIMVEKMHHISFICLAGDNSWSRNNQRGSEECGYMDMADGMWCLFLLALFQWCTCLTAVWNEPSRPHSWSVLPASKVEQLPVMHNRVSRAIIMPKPLPCCSATHEASNNNEFRIVEMEWEVILTEERPPQGFLVPWTKDAMFAMRYHWFSDTITEVIFTRLPYHLKIILLLPPRMAQMEGEEQLTRCIETPCKTHGCVPLWGHYWIAPHTVELRFCEIFTGTTYCKQHGDLFVVEI